MAIDRLAIDGYSEVVHHLKDYRDILTVLSDLRRKISNKLSNHTT